MSKLSRRSFLQSASALSLAAIATTVRASASDIPSDVATGEKTPFSRADVVARAKALAGRPYKPRSSVPADWLEMTYDQYRSIQFDVTKALWADTDRSYNVDFFLPGLYFERAVQVHAVTDGFSTNVPFDMSRFKKHPEISPELSQEGALGYFWTL